MNPHVGYAATTILEQIVKDYVREHTAEGKYTGELQYLLVLPKLIHYNKGQPK